MRSMLRHVFGVTILAAAPSGLLVAPGGVASAAAPAFCSQSATYPGTTITWTGKAAKAHSHDWNDPANWSPKTVPDAAETPATYQAEYVCIGTTHGGGPASVTISGGDSRHIAGIDIGKGAQLTIAPGASLFLGAANSGDVVPSYVEKTTTLLLDAGVLGGNAPVNVAGTMHWSGTRSGKHKLVATQTSSECVFDSSLSGCPGDTSPGGGSTVITKTGTLLVDGKGFGGTVLGDQRSIDNSGTISLSNVGFVLMNGGTTLTDEPGSGLNLDGQGGVYRGAKEGSSQAPSIVQTGAVTVDAPSTSVLGAAVTLLAPGKREVVVRNGGLALDAPKAPVARLARNTTYGVGSCVEPKNQMCRSGDATSERPQAALVTTSTLAPKTSKVGVALAAGPKKVHGKKVIGKAVNVKAPTIKTTHATHIGFGFDTTTKGISAHTKPSVYRNGHVITLCKVHGITATNTSCIFSEGPPKKGGADTKGDLSVVVISIQPNAHWLVAK